MFGTFITVAKLYLRATVISMCNQMVIILFNIMGDELR